jgi:acyl carrier protein
MSHLSYLLIEITRTVFDMQEACVNRTANFVDDLGADSLDCVELMMALEDAFDIEFADDELSKLTTISALEDFLLHRVADNPSFRSLMSA